MVSPPGSPPDPRGQTNASVEEVLLQVGKYLAQSVSAVWSNGIHQDRKSPQNEGTKVFVIELRKKLRQKGRDLEHGLGMQIIKKSSYQKSLRLMWN